MTDKLKSFLIAWVVILIINQIFIFAGCFAIYCLIAALPHTGGLAFLWMKFVLPKLGVTNTEIKETVEQPQKATPESSTTQSDSVPHNLNRQQQAEKPPSKNHNIPKPDFYKNKGDIYEQYIGQQFEKKGELVIYNGFIRGYEDEGVDIVSVSSKLGSINLIQCKNWTSRRMTLEHISSVFNKLSEFSFSSLDLPSDIIRGYLSLPYTDKEVDGILTDAKKGMANYKVGKTLYLASEKVVELEVGPHLAMMSANIFKYKDMKIVMKDISVEE